MCIRDRLSSLPRLRFSSHRGEFAVNTFGKDEVLPRAHGSVVSSGTVVSCLALNESDVGVDLVLIETSLLFLCKFLFISMRTASVT